jgi:2-amino-4-hydroxy-6-hydroxymethyldihydropteridine diphosphokinase
VFGFGGNLGDPRAAIADAIARLARRFGPLEVAPLYRTEAVATDPQPDYLNTVAVGFGEVEPEALLEGALAVEAELGRHRGAPAAPRTIDVDLLLAGDLVRATPELTLPHPRLRERRFVLAPLADLLPDLPLPPDGATARRLLETLPARPWAVRLGARTAP